MPSGVQTFVGRVESRLQELTADSGDSEYRGAHILSEASSYLTMAPSAKRARPRLVYHFGRALDRPGDELVALAVAAEFVHTASLLHDDVVDAGSERRDRPTVNVRWNNITAVLSGDALLCAALEQLERMPPAITARAVDVVSEMTRSIMHEVDARRRTDLDWRDWEIVAEGKTGALFGWCGLAAALAADRPELVDRFDTCGRRLGIAFQLADDIKDLIDFDSGKDRFADIRNGNPSYPLIRAIEEDAEIARSLQALWEEDPQAPTAAEIAEAIHATDALGETRRLVRAEVDRALEALGQFVERPGGRRIAGWAHQLCEAV
jgi:octaprenyl-diphosphate synthase